MPGPISLRSASDGRIVRQHAAGAELINFVQFAPDSQSLVACCDKELNAWSVASRELTKGDNFRFVSTDTLGHVVSPDGRFYAEEDGEYVSPGVLYWPVKSNRQLCIRQVSDNELVANVKAPDSQATKHAAFKPIRFLPDGSQLLYQEYAEPTWGSHLSSFLSDPLHPKLADRAQGLRLVDSQTGERSLEIWPSKRIWGGGIFFPDGKHLQVDREVWAVPWSRPWFRILGIPIVVVGLWWMPEMRRWRRIRSESRLE
ncbi:hypothetical protein [Rhodopirellula sp. SWK7]|uniref:hypothetical protein n=1 Tax=Rhodopirellula sp. SWK7 TaxID=595460 RepID=UPI001562FDE2|nr:hypothetical protein [Rhodopirellula sp. SWK7]